MNEKSPTLKRDWAGFDVVVWPPIPPKATIVISRLQDIPWEFKKNHPNRMRSG
jgi:hypothetical protein